MAAAAAAAAACLPPPPLTRPEASLCRIPSHLPAVIPCPLSPSARCPTFAALSLPQPRQRGTCRGCSTAGYGERGGRRDRGPPPATGGLRFMGTVPRQTGVMNELWGRDRSLPCMLVFTKRHVQTMAIASLRRVITTSYHSSVPQTTPPPPSLLLSPSGPTAPSHRTNATPPALTQPSPTSRSNRPAQCRTGGAGRLAAEDAATWLPL